VLKVDCFLKYVMTNIRSIDCPCDLPTYIMLHVTAGEVPALPPPHLRRKVWCYPVQLAAPVPRMPTIEYLPEHERALLRWRTEAMPINIVHLQKLVRVSLSLCLEIPCQILYILIQQSLLMNLSKHVCLKVLSTKIKMTTFNDVTGATVPTQLF
jgi:hypothetical protein